MTVPDDRAVGGLIKPGMTVDVLVERHVNVPQDLLAPASTTPTSRRRSRTRTW